MNGLLWGKGVSRLIAAVVAVTLASISIDAHAQYATGGTGLHRGRIFWVDWGNNGENIFSGRTIVRGFNIDTPATAANRLDITCTLSGATNTAGSTGLFVYTPGNWQGDGLDELYNIGGNQPGNGANPNTLSIGLATSVTSTVEFNFTCSATLGGAPFALNGLVFADSEASGASEYVSARLTGGGTLRVIDQISQCGSSTTVSVLAGPEVRFNGPTAPQNSCEGDPAPLRRGGPALVGFIDGATSARVIARGSGVSAVAVGAVIELEYSEAIPNTYGNASHILDATWSGGVATAGVNYNNPANLATFAYGARLGATVQPDADANGVVGGSDVDALPKTTGPLGGGYANVTSPEGPPGSTYSIANVACIGPASVAGWIDFNGNGVFDASERSGTVACPAGSSTVTLTWTIPAAGTVPQTTSYMRLRTAPLAAGIANPTGIATDGETEDYRIVIPNRTLTLQKTWVGARVNDTASLQTTGLTTNATLASVANTASETDVGAAVRVFPGQTATLSEILGVGNVGLYTSALACTGAADTNPADGLVINSADTAVVCTYTNTRQQADLRITKTNTPGVNGEVDQAADTVVSGTAKTYTLVVTNNGPSAANNAVVTDAPSTGLTCSTATCTAAGGATCPAQTGAALMSLLQGAGATVPTFPVSASVTFLVNCVVQ
jgi:uncharacterized repeat protein (TIGR01451 family)